MASIEGPSFWWERKGHEPRRRVGISVHDTYPVVWSLLFSPAPVSAPCISYSVKYSLPLDLPFVRIIESIVSCFSVFSYLVVWFEKLPRGEKTIRKKKKIIILHCSLCTIFVDNVLLKGCLFSAPLH